MKRKLDVWTSLSLIVLAIYMLFLFYPLFNLLRSSFLDNKGAVTLKHFERFFGEKYYLSTLLNSLKLSITTTAVALLLGVPMAYFYNMYLLRGKRFIQVVAVLCMMSAPFIGAYSWILLLGRAGVITRFIQSTFGIQMPSIYGFGGIVLVLSTRLFPLVFMYVSAALRTIDNSLLEASVNLGDSTLKRFFRVIIPLCMPSILASALMVFMRSMADFGTPLLIGEGYRTFPVEIYNQYVGETGTNHNFAAAISVVAIAITALVFFFQKNLNSHYRFSINATYAVIRKKPRRGLSIFIHTYIYSLLFISMLPQLYVIYTSFRATNTTGNAFKTGFSLQSYTTAFHRMGSAITNTLEIGLVSIMMIVLLSVLIAYLVVRRRSIINEIIDTLSMIPSIIPGAVIGIALILALGKRPFLLTGTFIIMVIAMSIRRMPYTIRSSIAILQQIPMSMEEASRSLGASKIKSFVKVTMPMMSSGIISGAILSWVTILTELSCSVILYTSRTQTLTVSIYAMVSRGTDGPAAAIATILTVFTIVSMLIFLKVSKSDQVVI